MDHGVGGGGHGRSAPLMKPCIYRVVDPTARSATTMRHDVRRALASSVPGVELNEFLIAFNEAMINAVRHGGARPITVHVEVTSTDIVAVVQNSGGRDVDPGPMGDEADLDAETGRGFRLAAALVDSLQVFSDGGTMVRMTKRLGCGGGGRAGSPA